jgi:hypothetical protein
MWDENFGREIARLLNLMADKPDSKPHPTQAGIEAFEGGEVKVTEGVTSYTFSDGAEAIYGTGRAWQLTIKLATGDEVYISVPLRKCSQCGSDLFIGDRYCRRCGRHGA